VGKLDLPKEKNQTEIIGKDYNKEQELEEQRLSLQWKL
jgi:hypothetical protein